jgi:hypothetical protein
MDTDWYAVDRDGHVAHFGSGEAGAVPRAALAEEAGGVDVLGGLHRRAGNELVYDLDGRIEPGRPPHWRTALHDEQRSLGPVLMFLSSADLVREELAAGGCVTARASRGVAVIFRSLSKATSDRAHEAGQCLGCFPHFAAEEQPGDERPPSPAELGLFSFEHLCENWISGPYGRSEQPSAPLSVGDLPPELQDAVAQVRFDKICFAEAPFVQPLEHVPCESWECAQLASDFTTVKPIPGREDEYRAYSRDLQEAEGAGSKLKIEQVADEAGSRAESGASPRHRRIAWGLIALGGALLIVAVWLIIRSFR